MKKKAQTLMIDNQKEARLEIWYKYGNGIEDSEDED